MSCRALICFMEGGPYNNDGYPLINVYQHGDGYPDDISVELAKTLKVCKQPFEIGEFAAEFIAVNKSLSYAGGIYVQDSEHWKISGDNCDLNYIYIVCGGLSIDVEPKVYVHENISGPNIFKGPISKMMEWAYQNKDYSPPLIIIDCNNYECLYRRALDKLKIVTKFFKRDETAEALVKELEDFEKSNIK